MKIFVTGATGFIGLHLCRRLIADGHEVHALVRTPRKRRQLPAEVQVLEGDLSVFQDETLELPEVDVFVHLAGVVAGSSPQHYWEVNYVAVKHVAACLERQRFSLRRMLFASSLAAAGPSARLPRRESDVDRPIDPYGRAKKQAELALAEASFPVTSFRPALVLGPGDPAFLTLFKLAKRGVGFRVARHRQRLSFVGVSDAVEAIVLMAQDSSRSDKTYFVAHPRAVTLEELWRGLGQACDRQRVAVLPVPKWALRVGVIFSARLSGWLGVTNQLDAKQYQQLTAPAWTCDSAALRSDLGWTPRVDLAAGARAAADGYRAAGWL